MTIVDKPLAWYVEKLNNGEPFSLGMYGDGEWLCLTGRLRETQHGCVCDTELQDKLREGLKFRDDAFYFSMPKVLYRADWTGVGEGLMQKTLENFGVAPDWEVHEKDMWDGEMKVGGLGPLIQALRQKDLVIVGNQMLRGLTFLRPVHVIPLQFPNWHLDRGIEQVVSQCLDYGKSAVYMIAGGPASVLVAQRLHGLIPNSWVLHLGSIWDGFVGMGAMRGFRLEMYNPLNDPRFMREIESSLKTQEPFEFFVEREHQTKYKEWATSNLKGIVNDWAFPTLFNP